jgi:RNA polymerase sigma-70 factor (ECF subfamily)
MGLFFRRAAPKHPDNAFTAFYTANLATVLRILRRIGVHDADMPDITQQVFLKIHKHLDVSAEERINPPLETISRQQAAEHYRLYRHRFERPEADVGIEKPAEGDDVQIQLERHELDQIVQQVLASMEPIHRDVLVRHEFQNESLEGIAKALDIGRNTAGTRLAEAKTIFRLRAERIIGKSRAAMLLLPFETETASTHWDPSPAFLDDINQRVWSGLTRELDWHQSPPPVLVGRGKHDEAPQSGARRIHTEIPAVPSPRRSTLIYPALLLATFGFGGILGALFWPHDLPLIARHIPPMQRVNITIDQHPPEHDAPQVAVSRAPETTVVAIPTPSIAIPTPRFDRELSTLEGARSLLVQAKYADALVALRQHEREFPQCQLAEIRSHYITLALEGQKRAITAISTTP